MGLATSLREILAKINTVTFQNMDGVDAYVHSGIWNNQHENILDGTDNFSPYPAAYLEYLNESGFNEIGGGYLSSDPIFRLHILHTQYDAGNGEFDQNLLVFDLRDKLISVLNHFKPSGMGSLTFIGEQPDYDHNNVYHYIIDFTATFIDDSASICKDLIIKQPPLELETQINVEKSGENQPTEFKFIING